MLQRAASNAYSWWWASSIRTKQSKWLDNDLQEMEENVKAMVKLIEVDADSFAKKAEIYFQRRPELVSYVEGTYRAYKALADRYDRISGDLHKANHTLASAFPDQMRFAMQDDEDDASPRASFTTLDTSKLRKPPSSHCPQINFRNQTRDTPSALKKHPKQKVSSNITKEKAQIEVDRLQKEILILQTEKEFVKCSYESGLAKFWEIENQITGLQDEVCNLQDEFSASSIIEDDEARALMAATAIKSCEESLVSIQQQQRKSCEEACIESKRIREARNRLLLLKGEECLPEVDEEKENCEVFLLKNDGKDLYSLCRQMKQHFQVNSDTSVVDIAERIDELIEKVISLEQTVSTQTVQIQTLRSETDELQKHLQCLEEDKANLINDSNIMNVKLRQAEDELHRVQDMEKDMRDGSVSFQTHLVEACNHLNNISEKLQSNDNNSTYSSEKIKELEEEEKNEVTRDIIEDQLYSEVDSSRSVDNSEKLKVEGGLSSLLEKIKLVDDGPKGRQKLLLYEYTSILRNYKETKKKMAEMEKKNQEYHFEMMAQIQELKSTNAVKDQEIRALRRKLFSHTPSDDAPNSIQLITSKSGSTVQILNTEFDQHQAHSPDEEKFNAELDTLLEENLDFWLRFSTSYHQMQKFETCFKDLKAEMGMLKEFNKEGGSGPASPKHSSKQETTAMTSSLEKKLRELHTELQVWLEQNMLLKGELQSRLKSLCNIQEENLTLSRDTESEVSRFNPYQAAKFQGELLNMQKENNKVSKELQTGLDHVKKIQHDVAKALSKLRESFDLSESKSGQQNHNFRHLSTKSKIPLRTFLFGERRKKASIFACMSPALYKHHGHMKSGL